MANGVTAARPPAWFWVVAVLLTLWGAQGCWAAYLHWTVGAEAMGPATDYDRRLFAALPGWYHWDFLIAVVASLLGGIALLMRSRTARLLFTISLIAVVIQFAWVFSTTDLIAVKGAAATLPFPLFITAVAILSVWFAGYAYRRGWLR